MSVHKIVESDPIEYNDEQRSVCRFTTKASSGEIKTEALRVSK